MGRTHLCRLPGIQDPKICNTSLMHFLLSSVRGFACCSVDHERRRSNLSLASEMSAIVILRIVIIICPNFLFLAPSLPGHQSICMPTKAELLMQIAMRMVVVLEIRRQEKDHQRHNDNKGNEETISRACKSSHPRRGALGCLLEHEPCSDSRWPGHRWPMPAWQGC